MHFLKNPVFFSLCQIDHKINPRPCSVNRLTGTCMFVWECINTEGHHIGMCVDTFMFGSCCAHNLTASQIAQLPDASEPAILYTQPGVRPPPSSSFPANRPSRPRPKPSTTARPALYLPNNDSVDRVSSSNGRPVHNQIRPVNVNYDDVNSLYSSIDKADVSWNSSPKPSHHTPLPTPSQHFQNSLPDRYSVYSKPHPLTSQSSTRSPSQMWTTTASTEMAGPVQIGAAASNFRPHFISRPTVLSTVLPVQHRHNSSHSSVTSVATVPPFQSSSSIQVDASSMPGLPVSTVGHIGNEE